jgi:shikimate dehydrogenase
MTRRVALLGNPLKRRHSQVMHDAAFAAAGIDARYELLELDADEVPAAIAAARGPEWLGLGVTAPYKRVVAGLCDAVEADAERIGAVNNVAKLPDGRLVGFNSDAPGFQVGVELAMGRTLSGTEVVVAGAGGAAHAVVFACLSGGARRVTVGNRTVEDAVALARRFSGVGGEIAAVGLDDPRSRRRSGRPTSGQATGQMVDPDDDRRGSAARERDRSDRSTCRPRRCHSPRRGEGLRAANGLDAHRPGGDRVRALTVGGLAGVMRVAVEPPPADGPGLRCGSRPYPAPRAGSRSSAIERSLNRG